MNHLNLSPVKKIEIILEGAHQEFATDLLDRAGVTGYTLVGNLSGKGRHGFHEGHLMFNEDAVLIMIILGGIGSPRGRLIAAAIVTITSDALKSAGPWRFIVISMIIMVVLWFFPGGIAGLWEKLRARLRRRYHRAEEATEAEHVAG